MPRKGSVAKRDVLPDPIYNSKLVSRLINKIMLDGKKGTAQQILYTSFKIIETKTERNALEVFEQALNNVMPTLELKVRRIGGANYQVPVEVSDERRKTFLYKRAASWHRYITYRHESDRTRVLHS